MKTSCIRQVSLALVTTAGLLIGAGGCAVDAATIATPPERTSKIAPQAPQDPPPPRPTTKEGCDACQGLWAPQGIEGVEMCLCKTTDEGHDCIDGKDCQGECLLEGDPEFHVMVQGDPPLGYYQGRCASYDATFGCFWHIPDDTQSQLPLAADQAGQLVCVD